jgi:hypothetical protein
MWIVGNPISFDGLDIGMFLQPTWVEFEGARWFFCAWEISKRIGL